MEALAVLMQDVLGLNHALRRDKGALLEQVRRLLCKKADLLSQACPPACPVVFPETALDDLGHLGSVRACHTPGDTVGELKP